MPIHELGSDSRQPSRIEGSCFLAACLLALLACNAHGASSQKPAVPGEADPRLSTCESGDSLTCNQVGEEMWTQQAYTGARDWFAVSCARMDDLVANGQRMVELGARVQAARQVVDATAQGAKVDPAASSAALETIESVKPEGDELRARIEGCIRVGDTHHMQDNHAGALPYFDAVCKLRAIQPQVEPLIQGLKALVDLACDGSAFSRQKAAADAMSAARLRGILVEGDAAPQAQAICPDLGKSCETDPATLHWSGQCSAMPTNRAPCHCAAAANSKCLIARGCYAESGAQSSYRLSALQQAIQQNAAAAEQLGLACP